MGRRAKLKKARVQALATAKAKRKQQRSAKPKTTTSSYTVDDLLTRAEDAMDAFQLELAVKFCDKALGLEPDCVRVLDTLGPLLLETGEADRALDCFKRSIDLSPLTGHSKYLYMAQLSEGVVAIDYIKRGIEIMTKLLEGVGGGEACASVESVTSVELSNAYCALAEVYLTDSCFSADAGSLCQEACSKALELCSGNAEALQVQASCLLSLERTDEAKETLVKSVSLWLPSGDDVTVMSLEGVADVPPYWSRVNTAKLLLEMGEHQTAFLVLEGLLKDDDEVIAVWYLMGWLHTLTKDADSARFYLEQTLTLFSKHESDEEDILKHTQELLDELGPASDECDVGVACDDVGGACEDGDSSDDQCGTTMDTS
ncbi:uncharacterized protein LOC135335514 [Halichondria panicea]|uniref:uncharacterized protein LOC135335514 n=1 Tax=Halichondria panicea TaxID=6063 RepID=UPI00312B897B